jgi:hypothetical protein
VKQINQGPWWPDGIREVGRISNDDLFEIDNVGDEEEIDQEEGYNKYIAAPLRQWNDFSFHVRSPSFLGGCP